MWFQKPKNSLTKEEIETLENAGQQYAATKDRSHLETAFKIFDRNGDGKVTAFELKTVLSSLTNKPASNEEVEQMLNTLDTNKDGVITISEFVNEISKL